MNKEQALAELHADLGLKRLHPFWANVEMVLGLTSVGVGLFIGIAAWSGLSTHLEMWTNAVSSLALFVLGGYLTLAGHRSHLYQSQNMAVAYLAMKMKVARAGTTAPAPGRG